MPTTETNNEALNGQHQHTFYRDDGVVIKDGVDTYSSRYSQKSRTGELHRLRPPDLDPTPYTLSHLTSVAARGSVKYRVSNGLESFQGIQPALAIGNRVWPNNRTVMVNEAIIDALTRLKDQRVNLGVALATASQTADMVSGIGKSLAELRSAVRHYDRKDIRRAAERLRMDVGHTKTNRLPRDWLYYHYALKPTLADAHGSVLELVREIHPSDWMSVAKGKSKRDFKVGPTPVSLGTQNCYGHFHSDQQYESVSCRVRVQPSNTMFARMATLGVTNPAEVLWEKVPFSFVADWFFSIGDFFHVLDATLGYDVKGYDYTYIRKRIQRKHAGGTWGPLLRERNFSDAVVRDFFLDRKTFVTSPLFDVIPRVKLNPLSMKRLSLAASLVATAFTGKQPRLRYG